MNKSIVTVVAGLVLGFLGSKLLILQYLTLIPWGIAGLLIGYFSNSRSEAIKNGALYGFSLGFAFMLGVYQGNAPTIARIPFFVLLGLVSAVCALLLSIVGNFFKTIV